MKAFFASLAFFLSVCTLFAQTPATASITASETVRLLEKIAQGEKVPVVTCIDLDASAKLLAIGGDDLRVRLWSVPQRQFVAELGRVPNEKHRDWVRGLAFSPDRKTLATVSQDGQIRLWNVQDGKLLRSFSEPVPGKRICFQPDSTRFAVCGFDRQVRIYDTATDNLVTRLEADSTNNDALAFSADGTLLAAGGRTGIVRVWNTADFKYICGITGDGRRTRAVAFSPDASQIAIGGDGPFIIVCNPQTGKTVKMLPERPGKTFSLVFCGENQLASGESDSVIRLWNVADGKQTSILSGHTGTISTLVYEPVLNQLISGSFDTTVRFWNLTKTENE